MQAVKIAPPEPWCAAFVCWCIDRARQKLGLEQPIKYSAWTPSLYATCKPITAAEATPGDLFFIYSPAKKQIIHVGFVASRVSNGIGFSTIEGPTMVAALMVMVYTVENEQLPAM